MLAQVAFISHILCDLPTWPLKRLLLHMPRSKPSVLAAKRLQRTAQLRQRVENTSQEDLGIEYFPPPEEKERRWSVFVGFAVERFERWCQALQPAHSDRGIAVIMPPLDVMMVWHTYLLNPGWATEDALRVSALKGLWKAGKAFAAALGMGLGQLLDIIPTNEDNRVQDWVSMTATPFDPFESMTKLLEKTVICPKCDSVNSTPFLCADGTGFLQLKFTRVCNNPTDDCFFNITHDALIRKHGFGYISLFYISL
ncbi:hypothetical protein MIND_00931600 [Mycena indigotica]|uniref:Uncharacterized protein n=1 Tax=Mycena indigotica TaxID=2126181 RepID=A0A8H6SDK5_9AGAR|nr:uncharacterized protein MIND_00931600 [Mycena indigotica]KAF7296993.1 hypothetical protein MIND_00931600 [Mycena indigotica]